jgi:hypothetical protein
MPDDHVGFFVSYNSLGKQPEFSQRTALWQAFLNRYFPYTPQPAQPLSTAKQDETSLTGSYWLSRRSETNIAAVTSALSQTQLSVNSDGTISLDLAKDFAGNPKRYEEIAPMLFREIHGQGHLAFLKDYAGQPMIASDLPIFVFQPVPPLKNQKLNLAVLIGAAVMMALTLLFWPINAMLRWHYRYGLDLRPEYRRLRFWTRIVCFVDLAFLASFGLWLSSVDENIALLGSRFDPKLHAMQVIGLFGVVGTLIAINYCVRSWAADGLWFWTRVWNTLLMLACVGYSFFLLNWHMLNFRLNY